MATNLIPFGLGLLIVMQSAIGRCEDEARTIYSTATTAEEPRDDESTPTQPATPQVSVGHRETIVVRLDHVPATDIAESVKKWFESEEKVTGEAVPTVVAVVITNDLIVSSSPQQLATIRAVIGELDRPSRQICVKAMLVELTFSNAQESVSPYKPADVSNMDFDEIVAQLKELGDVRVFAQPELLCADNQPAFLQSGGRIPRVTAAANTSRGLTTQVALENVGTMLGVTARASELDRVTLEIDLERSQLGSGDEGTPLATSEDHSVVRSPHVKTLNVQTTVSLRAGQTVILGGLVDRTEHHGAQLLILLQPTFVHQEN
jgi:type II secretory pathway component GspD/PulD (secretin)